MLRSPRCETGKWQDNAIAAITPLLGGEGHTELLHQPRPCGQTGADCGQAKALLLLLLSMRARGLKRKTQRVSAEYKKGSSGQIGLLSLVCTNSFRVGEAVTTHGICARWQSWSDRRSGCADSALNLSEGLAILCAGTSTIPCRLFTSTKKNESPPL